MTHPVGETDPREGVDRFLLIGHAVEILREHDVFDRGEERDEVELLEDESDFFGAHAVQFCGGDAGHVLAIEPDFAGRGAVEASDEIDERRFPGARGTHDRQPFARSHVERDVVKRVNGSIAGVLARAIAGFFRRVEFGDVLDLNHSTRLLV
jgi:hypothetical protein